MVRSWIGGVVAAMALGAASPSAANVVTFAFEARMVDGQDNLGLFGPVGGDLTGDLVRAVFKFDTDLGERGPLPADPPTPAATDAIIGGANIGIASPLLSATVTINGVTVDIGGDLAAAVATSPGNYVLAEAASQNLNFVGAVNESPDAPASLDTPFAPHGEIAGSFFIGDAAGAFNTSGDFAAVPEPAAWSLLILGLGCVGAALRAGRRWRPAPGEFRR
jgi:PEP-CTERM motif